MDIASMTAEVWNNLRVGDRFKTPDKARGVEFIISKIGHDHIFIQPQGISISPKAFQSALEYLSAIGSHSGNRCVIRSSNDKEAAGPLCKATRAKNGHVRCINYIVPILKAQGLVEFSGDRPNTVWLKSDLLESAALPVQPSPTEKLFNYIALLEETNDQLRGTLKKCHMLLVQFADQVPDPKGWEAMLEDLQSVIKSGERASEKKKIH